MQILENVSIKNLTTMKLGGNAKYLIEIYNKQDIIDAINFSKSNNLPFYVIGGGSNIIAHDEMFNGVIFLMKNSGFEIIDDNENSTDIRIFAGENWDEFTESACKMNLSGIEAMSGIPGTAGAAPVQNVGAYGQEIADTLISVEAFDTHSNEFTILNKSECEFGYRNSIFKNSAKDRYVIFSITIKLFKKNPNPPFYDSLQKYFDEYNIYDFTPQIIRDTVIKIRDSKLPNPKYLSSAGSFFKNSIVKNEIANSLLEKFPNMPIHKYDEQNSKIPSGWLIDNSGLRGQLLHGMRVYEKNALVLVNESATNYHDLEMARQEIIDTVFNKFGIKIEQEPLEI